MDKEQYGFRPRCSTTSALVDIDYNVRKERDRKSTKAVCLITFDFSKAFNKLDYSLLISKLMRHPVEKGELSIPDHIVRWLMSFLTNRKQKVRVEDACSKEKMITSGMPQGSLLGLYLFNVFVSDLKCICKNSRMVKYADDTSIIFTICYEDDLV